MGSVREDLVPPTSADALDDGCEVDEAFADSRQNREHLLAVLHSWMWLIGLNFGGDVLDEYGEKIELVCNDQLLLLRGRRLRHSHQSIDDRVAAELEGCVQTVERLLVQHSRHTLGDFFLAVRRKRVEVGFVELL